MNAQKTYVEFVSLLESINDRRLFDYELTLLSELVIGLDESCGELPRHLKYKYKKVGDYLLRKRLKRVGF